ncbi:hypothetical protein E2320_014444 [Naja naja]|nr:hypothetical protein E2320_014444 [Naja naja]
MLTTPIFSLAKDFFQSPKSAGKKISGCSFKSCSKRIKTFGERKPHVSFLSLRCFQAMEEPKGPDLLPASPPTCPPLTSQEPLRPSKQHKRLRRRHYPPALSLSLRCNVNISDTAAVLLFCAFQARLLLLCKAPSNDISWNCPDYPQ